MIRLERMNGSELWLNPVHIESVEQTPDTVITLTNGHKYIVAQGPEEITSLIQQFWSTTSVWPGAGGTAGSGSQAKAGG
ncbi:MAG: flagellar FlbD family protein [Alicyclobacillus sp.]|nr:flagellar FlbD family protein [Alicyclobacillus sp.]